MKRVADRPRRLRRQLQAPLVRLAAAVCVMVGGAYLIALWAVGIVLVASGAFYVLVVWDDGTDTDNVSELPQHDAVLERWRQSR